MRRHISESDDVASVLALALRRERRMERKVRGKWGINVRERNSNEYVWEGTVIV